MTLLHSPRHAVIARTLLSVLVSFCSFSFSEYPCVSGASLTTSTLFTFTSRYSVCIHLPLVMQWIVLKFNFCAAAYAVMLVPLAALTENYCRRRFGTVISQFNRGEKTISTHVFYCGCERANSSASMPRKRNTRFRVSRFLASPLVPLSSHKNTPKSS